MGRYSVSPLSRYMLASVNFALSLKGASRGAYGVCGFLPRDLALTKSGLPYDHLDRYYG